MILLVNGAFGIGKTSVAREIIARTEGAAMVDPEMIGIALQRSLRLVGRRVDDFQDLWLWRKLIIPHIYVGKLASDCVVVPMAFSNLAYLNELRKALSWFDARVIHVCLVAPVEVVYGRLRGRGADPSHNAWEFRRAAECCIAHTDSRFGHRIDAAEGTPNEIASEIIAIMRRQSLRGKSISR